MLADAARLMDCLLKLRAVVGESGLEPALDRFEDVYTRWRWEDRLIERLTAVGPAFLDLAAMVAYPTRTNPT